MPDITTTSDGAEQLIPVHCRDQRATQLDRLCKIKQVHQQNY